jgi:hypothetical protein
MFPLIAAGWGAARAFVIDDSVAGEKLKAGGEVALGSA